MNAYEIAFLLKKLGVRETKAETYPNTYSLVNGASFLAQQVNNRDSASWKKAEYIILTDASVSQGILEGWKKLTERDPLPSAIQKLCVPASHDKFDVYDSQGKLIGSNSLDKIIKHTPDIVDFLNNKEPLIYPKNSLNPPSFTPSQVIYYGVPGCGKSNKIKQDFENGNVDEEAQVVRCVFHPEYTNADFVGQIFPVVKKDGKGVDYKFKPGPFTEILRRAYLNPHREFFLVIEEINRGNAAAIFGEMFQLLDRIKEGKDKSGFGPGWSAYFILNDDVNDYIRNIEAFDKFEHVGCVKPNLYKDMRDGNGNVVDAPDENGKKEIDFSTATSYSSLELTLQGFDVPQIFRESTSIRFPPNLSILATMNTSDQNVSTLDNAFQRRFDMELVRNEFESGDVEGFKTAAIKAQHDAVIEGTNCTWGDFWENINKKIIQYNRGLTSTEDKRLGPWFVCSVAGETGDGPRKIPAKTFTEKVLKYLWDDAFKFKRSQVFADGLSSLEQVVSAFEKAEAEKLKAVFKEF